MSLSRITFPIDCVEFFRNEKLAREEAEKRSWAFGNTYRFCGIPSDKNTTGVIRYEVDPMHKSWKRLVIFN